MIRAAWLVSVVVLAGSAGCSGDKVAKIAVPHPLQRTLAASGFRFAGQIERKLSASAKTEHMPISGRYEAPDRLETDQGQGYPPVYTIGDQFLTPDLIGNGLPSYQCLRAPKPFAPTGPVSLLRWAAAAKRVAVTASTFTFRMKNVSGVVTMSAEWVQKITFHGTAAHGFAESGEITYSDVGSAGHVVAPACHEVQVPSRRIHASP